MAENSQSTKVLKKELNNKPKKTSSWELFLFLFLFALVFGGYVFAGSPTPLFKTLIFQLKLHDLAAVKTTLVTSKGNTYLGTYRIVLNTLDPALIGSGVAVTTSPDTWTDYFELNSDGWWRNHRIIPPTSPQSEQWGGLEPITPGTISSEQNGLSLALTLPDFYLGNSPRFNVSVITYLAREETPENLHAIDALGPKLSTVTPIDYMIFDPLVSSNNTEADSGGLGDWATYPDDFPDLNETDYRNFDIKTFTVIVQ